ncbi:Major facilitator superfamily domain general substrate transporter protein [Rutstroemia sp. NJR-2017a BBW]|nr:Major facilitator superfamily domain general substrate transporter protein [Rutstroemia sp. NJR-2017a BBW]
MTAAHTHPVAHNVHLRASTFAVTGLAKPPESTTAATKVSRSEANRTEESRCITFFVDIGNLGMCTIALPTIKQDLGFDDGELQWVMAAYASTISSRQIFDD